MRTVRLIFGIICFAVLTAGDSIAQQRIYNYIQFTEKEGLPSDVINSLALDSAGLLWLTSKQGLSYFDGARFTHVPFQQGTSTYSNYLGKIAIDHKNRIWITTNDRGLLCYDRSKPVNNSLKQFHALVGPDSLIKTNLYEVIRSSSGLIYFAGQETDLQVLNPETGKVTQIKMPGINSKEPLSIYNIQEDRQGNLWIGTRYHGFIRYNPKTKSAKQIDFKNIGENGATGISFVNNKVFLGYYDYDLVSYDSESGAVEHSILGLGKNKDYYDNFISSIAYWREENSLLIGHNIKGLWSMNLDSNKAELIAWDNLMPILPQPSRIQALLPSKDGYWVATGSGLFYYAKPWNRVNTLIPLKANEEPILKLMQWDNEVWYRTEHSFGQLNAEYHRISKYPIQNIRVSMMTVHADNLYFSTFEDGVYVFNRATRKLQALPIQGEQKNFRIADCNNIIPDTINGEAVLWIGSWNSGLYKYSLKNRQIELFDRNDGLPDRKVTTIGKDAKGRIWLGMDGFGILRLLNKQRPSFQSYVQGDHAGDLMSNTIFAFYTAQNGDFWFTSASSGIGRIMEKDGEKFEFAQFYDRNPFPWLFAVEIKEDGKGFMWVKALDGVMLFDQQKQVFRHLLEGKGIYPAKNYQTTGYFLDAEKLIWTTNKGLILGNLGEVHQNSPIQVSPIISKFSVHNIDQSFRLNKKELLLGAKESSFSFAFSSDRQVLGYPLQYAYQLVGFDQDWVIAGSDLQAFYSNLPGGQYTFRLKVADDLGNWSPHIAEIPITLKSYWYATWWFKTLVALALLAAITFFFLYRIRQQKIVNKMQLSYNEKLEAELALKIKTIQEQAADIEREKQEKVAKDFKQKLYESELKAIRSQMNPHFIFNVLNSIEAYVVENDSENASKLIQKFSRLSRIVLENSQFSIVSIQSELQLVKLYLELERSRFDNAFDFRIDVDQQINVEETKVPSLLIQPLVENAVHHGVRHLENRKGKIQINVFESDSEVIIDIVDNGIGFSESDQQNKSTFKNSSFGIKGIEERLKMINDHYSSPIAQLHISDLNVEETGFRTLLRIILPKRGIIGGV